MLSVHLPMLPPLRTKTPRVMFAGDPMDDIVKKHQQGEGQESMTDQRSKAADQGSSDAKDKMTEDMKGERKKGG
ncbi:MAG: hypothetical protein AB7P76_03740 [Candidatus Melainabacteria bacterium]